VCVRSATLATIIASHKRSQQVRKETKLQQVSLKTRWHDPQGMRTCAFAPPRQQPVQALPHPKSIAPRPGTSVRQCSALFSDRYTSVLYSRQLGKVAHQYHYQHAAAHYFPACYVFVEILASRGGMEHMLICSTECPVSAIPMVTFCLLNVSETIIISANTGDTSLQHKLSSNLWPWWCCGGAPSRRIQALGFC